MGGATRVLISQLSACTEVKNKALLISGGPKEDLGKLPCPWIKHTYKTLGYIPGLIRSLIQAKRTFNPEIVHIHQPLIGFLAIMVFNKSIPRVYHFHSLWGDEKMSHARNFFSRSLSRMKSKIEKFVLRRMSHFIVLSDFSKQKLLTVVPNAKVEIIPGCVNLSHFVTSEEMPPENQDTDDPKLKLLSVRRLDPRMGLDLLIRSIAMFKEASTDRQIQCSIIGEGRQRDELEALIKELNVEEEVSLLGRVEEHVLMDNMRTAHLSILPTRELEGFGVSVIESLASGTPVMATSVGALPEFNRFPDAFHSVGEPTSESIFNGLQWAYENWKGRDLKVICQNVVRDNFSHEVVSQKLISFYNTVKG